MPNYSTEKELYSLARKLSKGFTKDKYKAFLFENDLIRRDILEEPDGRFSGILVKEEFIRETLFFMSNEKFYKFIELLQNEGKLPKKDETDGKLENNVDIESPEKAPTSESPKVEKTVFISYRRKDISWALAVYQYLTKYDFDVFFDYTNIASGDFEQIIVSNIKARAHFIVILTPSALDRCNRSDDWLRREIETAIDEKRNIIPLFFNGFSFGTPTISDKLSGKLSKLSKYNGLDVPSSFFYEAMDRLREKFLNIALDAVLHPVSDEMQKVVEEQKIAANEAIKKQEEENAHEEAKEMTHKYVEVNTRKGKIESLRKRIEEEQMQELDKLTKAQNKGQPIKNSMILKLKTSLLCGFVFGIILFLLRSILSSDVATFSYTLLISFIEGIFAGKISIYMLKEIDSAEYADPAYLTGFLSGIPLSLIGVITIFYQNLDQLSLLGICFLVPILFLFPAIIGALIGGAWQQRIIRKREENE